MVTFSKQRSITACILFFVLLGMLSCSPVASQEIESPQSSVSEKPEQRRQLWDFWSFMMLIHPPCPPPGAPHQPKHCLDDQSPSSSSSNANSANSAYYDNASSSSQSNGQSGANATSSGQSSANALGWWLLPIVASVLLAIFAIRLGTRRKDPGPSHEMSGVIVRRVGAVSAFADHVLPQPPAKTSNVV